MHVAVLGPLEVRVDGFPVATERLIEELWSADPPATAAAALQVHVSGLRKVIGAPLCTVPAGYLLDVPADAVDARAFAAAVALARRQHATDPRGAADRLAEALRAWRGPAFDGVPAGPVIRAAAVRLQHLRVGALEDWAEWELRLGRPDRGLLSTLVDRSMLIAQPDAAESRFSMLETIHVYAREQAAGSADLFERRSARAPHRAWYRELVEGAPPLGGDDHELWLARFAPSTTTSGRRWTTASTPTRPARSRSRRGCGGSGGRPGRWPRAAPGSTGPSRPGRPSRPPSVRRRCGRPRRWPAAAATTTPRERTVRPLSTGTGRSATTPGSRPC